MKNPPAAMFTTETVRRQVLRIMAVIAETAKYEVHPQLRLDGLMDGLMVGPTRPPACIKRSSGQYRRQRFTVMAGAKVLGRFVSVDAARLRFPDAIVDAQSVR